MKQVGITMEGHSQYDDRLWELLNGYTDLDPSYPLDATLDHIGLIPYMLVAGASVRTEPMPGDGHEMVLAIEIPDDSEEGFYGRLEELLMRGRVGW